MPNLPSTPSSTNHEAPKGSSLRTKIILVLSGFALGALIGGSVMKKYSDASKQKKSAIADVSHQNSLGPSSQRKNGAASLPFSFANGHSLNFQPMFDAEERAQLIENERRYAIAQDVIKHFCIQNEADQIAITNAVLEGYIKLSFTGLSEKGIGWREHKGWIITLEKENKEELPNHETSVRLEQEPPCNIPVLLKEIAQKKQKEEKIVEDLTKGDGKKFLEKFDTQKIRDEARALGIENKETVVELLKAIDKVKEVLNRNRDENAGKKLACEILVCEMRLMKAIEKELFNYDKIPDSDITEVFLDEIEKSHAIDDLIDEFENILSQYNNVSISPDVYDCLVILTE